MNFPLMLLQEINKVRQDPKSYAEYVLKYINNITTEKSKQRLIYFEVDDLPKISLHKGEQAFKECASYLNKLKPLTELNFCEELCIKIPEELTLLTSREYLAQQIILIKTEMKDDFKKIGFHYDNGGINPEISCLMQIVDDTNSNLIRRSNLLNENYTDVGISVGKLKANRYVVYLCFGQPHLRARR